MKALSVLLMALGGAWIAAGSFTVLRDEWSDVLHWWLWGGADAPDSLVRLFLLVVPGVLAAMVGYGLWHKADV